MIKISVKRLLWLLLIVGVAVGFNKFNGLVKQRRYKNAFSFLSVSASNYLQGQSADFSASINIKPEHFQKIEEVRNAALKRGVIIQPEDPYVPCVIEFNGEKIKGEIRLKGKMTDHVSGKKWSFRVKTKKNKAFMGMQRFTLQHPGTRGYVYEWLHHQLCKHEGIIALRYEFINLTLNGEDLGVYAVEENFGQPLVQNNERPKGPVFRFNPTLYWQARLNAVNRVYIAQEFTNFQNAHVEAFSKKETFTDSTLKAAFVEVNNLMNQVRWGQVSIAEAFDVEKLAMRYALLDMCGGYHSVDWSDVKFYYNPVLNKIEPVAYESFGPRWIDHIIGNYRFVEEKEAFPSEYHDIIFNDRAFFEAYIKALRKVSAPGYFESSLAPIQGELDKRVAIQYSEFPYKDFNLEVFKYNRRMIQKSLNAPKFVHAYLGERTADSLSLKLQVIESLPSEVLGVEVEDVYYPFEKAAVLPGLSRKHEPVFKTLNFALDSSIVIDTERAKNIKVVYRLLGDSVQKICEVFPYLIGDLEPTIVSEGYRIFNSTDKFITIDSSVKTYSFNASFAELKEKISIPKGWTIRAVSPLKLEFKYNAALQINGKLAWSGTDENPIQVIVGTNQANWLRVIDAHAVLKNVLVESTSNADVMVYNGKLSLENFAFIGASERFITCFRSELSLKNVVLNGASQSAIKISYGTNEFSQIKFLNCTTAIDSKGGVVELSNSSFFNCKQAIDTKRNDKVSFKEVKIDASETSIEVRDGSVFIWNGGTISNAEKAFKVHRKGNLYGPAKSEISGVEFDNVETVFELEENNTLLLNGASQNPTEK